MRTPVVSNLLGLAGAVVGGVLGYFLFFWIVKQGFYGLMIPGALMGLGCSLLAQHRSVPRGIVVAGLAVGLGLFTEWRFRPFNADGSFRFLLTHVTDLMPITLLMIGLGGVFGFWMGRDANPIFSPPEKTGTGSTSSLD